MRLNLAKALVSEPDLLLLDEPTNFLDITSIRWVERFLIAWPRELLVITHDRSFMDKVVTHVMGIHRQKVRKIAGTTDSYYGQIAQDEEIYEKTRLNDERRRKEVELFITRFRAKARLAGLVQSRVKALQKMEKRDKLEQLKDLEFAFREKPLPGKHAAAGAAARLRLRAGPAALRRPVGHHHGRGARRDRRPQRQGQDHAAQAAGRGAIAPRPARCSTTRPFRRAFSSRPT